MLEGFFGSIKTFFGTDKQYSDIRIPQLITGKKFELSQAEKISTIFTCVKILGETLSKLPLEKYIETATGKEKDKNSYLYELLHYNPNAYTTSQSFINAMETNRNLSGNSFAKINRNPATGYAESLEILYSYQVKSYLVYQGSLYYYVQFDLSKDKLTLVSSSDILHFKMMTKDGIWGMNPIEALRMNLSTSHKAMLTIDSFYDNNANSPKAIKSTVSGVNQKAMLEAVAQFNKDFSGSENSGKMIALPPNAEIQELKLNFADAQFIETVKFNANQIAALYGIPSHMVGNTEASKFNNVEQMGIGFKADTISPIARMYRQELEMKLLTTKQRANNESIEFNLQAMIETDHKTRLEGYKTLASFGAMSPNQISRIENMPTDPDGDVRIIPMNMMSLAKINKPDEIKPGGFKKTEPKTDNTDSNGE